jgi:Tol biopolymer transport system component
MGNCEPHFSPDGRWLFVSSEREFFQYRMEGSPTNWPLARTYPRATSGFDVGSGVFSADGKLLAIHADQRILRLVEPATGRELARLTPLPEAFRTWRPLFSPDNRWLAAVSDIGLHVWDLQLIRQRLREMGLDWE